MKKKMSNFNMNGDVYTYIYVCINFFSKNYYIHIKDMIVEYFSNIAMIHIYIALIQTTASYR